MTHVTRLLILIVIVLMTCVEHGSVLAQAQGQTSATPSVRLDALYRLDRNQNGQISRIEFLKRPRRARDWPDFDTLDRNGDSVITRADFGRALQRQNTQTTLKQTATQMRKGTVQYHAIPGVDPNLLSLDIYRPLQPVTQPRPVIVMIHGGGWSVGDKANDGVVAQKAPYYTAKGYVFISINYRLVPDHPFPAFAQDSARALAWVYENAAGFGGDPNRIALMGHSAGAHIAALITSDARYLRAHGLSPAIVKGTVLLDTGAYNISAIMNGDERFPAYDAAFGDDPQIWQAASPISYVSSGASIPPSLIFYTNRSHAHRGSKDFAYALNAAGIAATAYPVFDKSHQEINHSIGQPADRQTRQIDAFLNEIWRGA